MAIVERPKDGSWCRPPSGAESGERTLQRRATLLAVGQRFARLCERRLVRRHQRHQLVALSLRTACRLLLNSSVVGLGPAMTACDATKRPRF
jgi:hypothetical protein